MSRKIFIKTMGCQMNEYDSDRMVDALKAAHQMTDTDDPAEADLILLNTCSIRESSGKGIF